MGIYAISAGGRTVAVFAVFIVDLALGIIFFVWHFTPLQPGRQRQIFRA